MTLDGTSSGIASSGMYILCTSKKLHSVEFMCDDQSMVVYVDDIKKFVEILDGIRNSDKPTQFFKKGMQE